jgi:hypothetical protein
MLRIFIEDYWGMRVEYWVTPSDPVRTLKKMIKEIDGKWFGVCLRYVRTLQLIGWLERQRLEYQSLELQDDDSLESYQIYNDSVIQLSSKACVFVHVEFPCQQFLSFDIDPGAPVSHLQEMVEERAALPVGMKSPLTNSIIVHCICICRLSMPQIHTGGT